MFLVYVSQILKQKSDSVRRGSRSTLELELD